MGLWSRVKSVFTKKTSTPTKTETVTTRELAPVKQDPVRSIDTNQGTITVRGENAWTGGGGGSGGSTTTSQPVSVTYSGVTEEQTKEVLASKGYTQAYLSPKGGMPESPTTLSNPQQQSKPTFKKLTPAEAQENRRSILEKPTIVRGESGGISVFGTGARALTKTSAYVGYKLDPYIQKTSIKNLVNYGVRTDVSESFTSDLGKWVFFSPAMVTTAGYYKAVQPEKITYAGTTQRVGTNKINTELLYKTSTGKTGLAKSTTIVKPVGKNTYLSGTKAVGVKGGVGYKVPSGKLGFGSAQTYKGTGVAVTKTAPTRLGKSFSQVGFGQITTGKQTSTFIGGARGFNIGKVTGSQGVSVSKRGIVGFEGLTSSVKPITKIAPKGIVITKITKSPVASFTNVPSGAIGTTTRTITTITPKNVLSSIAESSTKQIVSASVKSTPQAIVPTLVGTTGTIASIPRASSISKVTPQIKQISLQKIDAVTETSTKNIPNLSGGAVAGLKASAIPITTTTPVQTQVPIIISSAPAIGSGFNLVPAPKGFIPFLPDFGDIGGAIKTPRIGKIKVKAEYGYTPSYTALAFGITGKKTAPLIGKQYTGLEFRPITKEWTNQFIPKRRKGKSKINLFM